MIQSMIQAIILQFLPGISLLVPRSPFQSRHKRPLHFHVAILVRGQHFAGDAAFAIFFVAVGDGAATGDYVADVRHAFEAYAEFA